MTNTGSTLSMWLAGRVLPPLWLRLLAVVALAAAAAGLGVRRGEAVGIIAALVYVTIALATLVAWPRTSAWSRQHPGLDSLRLVPLGFLVMGYLTDLSLGGCLGATALAGALLAGPPAVRRRWRSSRA